MYTFVSDKNFQNSMNEYINPSENEKIIFVNII